MNDFSVIRRLAIEYNRLLPTTNNYDLLKLQRAVNDNKMIRPVVLIDEVPWHEMNTDGSLTLECKDSFLREVEYYLRRKMYQYKYFPADMILPEFIPVRKVVHHSGIGVEINEEIIEQGDDNNIKSHMYEDGLEDEEDLEKLHNQIVTYDKEETERRVVLLSEILNGILPVKIVGIEAATVGTWDQLSELRGVTPILMDLIDRPEFMHALVRKLTDIKLNTLLQYEKLGLFEANPYTLHCTSSVASDLEHPADGSPRKLENVWGRGVAQIFATVGNDMHEEYDIDYMKETVGKCGLVYYGCCEPLDRKIDIVEKIPNLRKISITPWADVNVAAEAINGRYVIASKPNPAAVAVSALDEDNLKKEIAEILDACSKNSCSVELTLKDISTCKKNPENIIRWEQIVMDMVKNY